jgi:uncharacterized YigZ family protein
MKDKYLTPASNIRVKIPVGACRFIASVARVESEMEAKAFIEKVSTEFNDATHNAYAYKIGSGYGAVSRQYDAAEPPGTAGLPLLQAIEHAGLTNVVLVGTRYFGGVKLGIGGLIRAYRACADAGLAEAGATEVVRMIPFVLETPYDLMGNIMTEIASSNGEVDGTEYSAHGVQVRARVPAHAYENFALRVRETTRGKVCPEMVHTNR